MDPVPSPGATAPEVAYQWIISFIAGLPREDETFLNEATLAKATGTSRTPVREALLRLEAEGYIKRVPHKGAYVPPITDQEVRANLQARSVVEKWAVTSHGHYDHANLVALQGLIDQQRLAASDPVRFIELDTEFHNLIVKAAGNPVLADFYASLRQRQLRIGIQAISTGNSRTAEVLNEHQAIVDGLNGEDLALTCTAIDAHLGSTRRATIGY
ncbi:GntR family transcriptional regulator [Paenarthrobacter sp. YAF11_1]|uniref:GntR family transcriptional regulator n=1 Tax=Micrococcaceae TaxID=1268 RepID=UPI0028834614|nr:MULTISPECIES: GntR family transcriptional regulator [unclassified Arthrobacter]